MIDYTNHYLNSTTSVKAVAEAVKRYAHTITAVKFVNNSMKLRNTIIALQSIDKHMPNLQILELSKNELGLEGGKFLAQ